MSLLECLVDVPPRHDRGNAADAAVSRHMSEITAARERGYSWAQITKAARTAWNGEWPEERKLGCDTLALIYNRIKRATA